MITLTLGVSVYLTIFYFFDVDEYENKRRPRTILKMTGKVGG